MRDGTKMRKYKLIDQINQHIEWLKKCADGYKKNIDSERDLDEIRYLCNNLSGMVAEQMIQVTVENESKERDYDKWALDNFSDYTSFWRKNKDEIIQRILERCWETGICDKTKYIWGDETCDDIEHVIDQTQEYFIQLFAQKEPPNVWLEISRGRDDEEYSEMYDWL